MKRTSLLFILAAQAAAVNLPSAPALGRELMKSDQSAIADAGQPKFVRRLDMNLKPVIYDLNEVDSRWSTKYHLVVEDNINDPMQSYAFLFSKDAVEKRRTKAWIYSAVPLESNGKMMLAPLFIDNEGNLRDGGMAKENAPVLEVLIRNGRYTYPYVIRGRHGALDGRLLGMNAAPDYAGQLKPGPSNGIFAATTGGKADLLVNGEEISIHAGQLADQTFSMASINGADSGFAALMKSTLNTRSRSESVDEEIRKLAAFLKDRNGNEVLMLLTPIVTEWGAYTLEAYEATTPTLLEFFFPGRRHQTLDRQ